MDQPGNTWSHCLEQASLSDVGLHRANNQDSCIVALADNQTDFEERGHLLMVADGMGAHAAGELASKMATDIVSMVYKHLDRLPSEAILSALINANHQIHSRGLASPDFRGMGTTATAMVLLPSGALLAHVGDSRAYRCRNHVVEQLTFDHSLVWEMRAASQYPDGELPSYISKNIITRSLGPRLAVKVDLEGPYPLQAGDAFMLCSDGLSNQVKDDEIGAVLSCLPPKEAVQALVDLANLRGGPDNITVVVARVLGPQVVDSQNPGSSQPAPHTITRPVHPAIWTLIGVAALMTVGLFALGHNLSALLCFICVGIGGIAAMTQRYSGSIRRARLENLQFGRGPYVRCECNPGPELSERFNDMVLQLRENALQEGCPFDGPSLDAYLERTQKAKQENRWDDAVRESLQAIMYVMKQVRERRDLPPDENELVPPDEDDEDDNDDDNDEKENAIGS
jgi:protein phosphatase